MTDMMKFNRFQGKRQENVGSFGEKQLPQILPPFFGVSRVVSRISELSTVGAVGVFLFSDITSKKEPNSL